MQAHETFIIIINKVLRQYLFTAFIQSFAEKAFEKADGESAQECLSWVVTHYLKVYEEWEVVYEPSRVCATCMMEVESYLWCLYGTKRGNLWMMEKEGCDSLGAFKLWGIIMWQRHSVGISFCMVVSLRIGSEIVLLIWSFLSPVGPICIYWVPRDWMKDRP